MIENEFCGYVKMYNEVFYVDTSTGQGVADVLKKIDPLLCKMASKSYLQGCNFDDIKQELIIITMQGIRSYDPTKEATLSTFLHGHIRNKLISKLKNNNKLAHHASIFQPASTEYSSIRKTEQEVSFSAVDLRKKGRNEKGTNENSSFIDNVQDDFSDFSSPKFIKNDDLTFHFSVEKVIKSLDKQTAEIVRLICFEDFTIKDVSDKLGIPNWAVNNRIRGLAKRRAFKELLLKRFKNDGPLIEVDIEKSDEK